MPYYTDVSSDVHVVCVAVGRDIFPFPNASFCLGRLLLECPRWVND